MIHDSPDRTPQNSMDYIVAHATLRAQSPSQRLFSLLPAYNIQSNQDDICNILLDIYMKKIHDQAKVFADKIQ